MQPYVFPSSLEAASRQRVVKVEGPRFVRGSFVVKFSFELAFDVMTTNARRTHNDTSRLSGPHTPPPPCAFAGPNTGLAGIVPREMKPTK